jgi:hypothetical protein
MSITVYRAEERIHWPEAPVTFYGWSLFGSGEQASVHPFVTPEDRDKFVRAISARLPEQARGQAEQAAAFSACSTWGSSEDDRSWGSSLLAAHYDGVSGELKQVSVYFVESEAWRNPLPVCDGQAEEYDPAPLDPTPESPSPPREGNVYLTAWKDGHMLPDGFVMRTGDPEGSADARYALLDSLLQSLGIDAEFATTPGDAAGRLPANGYEELCGSHDQSRRVEPMQSLVDTLPAPTRRQGRTR